MDKLNELREKCREFETRLMGHPDFAVLQKLWLELGLKELVAFDGTYSGGRTVAGAKEGAGW